MGDPDNRDERTPDQKKPEVEWELSPIFKASWQKYLKIYPDIKAAMTEFNRHKRETPPKQLPAKMKDHKLDGPFRGFYDCHLADDAILLYRPLPDGGIKLITMCEHADLRGPRAKALVKRIK
jgi:addiction module RelE/StbE family toxin